MSRELLTPQKVWADFTKYLTPDKFGIVTPKVIADVKAAGSGLVRVQPSKRRKGGSRGNGRPKP